MGDVRRVRGNAASRVRAVQRTRCPRGSLLLPRRPLPTHRPPDRSQPPAGVLGRGPCRHALVLVPHVQGAQHGGQVPAHSGQGGGGRGAGGCLGPPLPHQDPLRLPSPPRARPLRGGGIRSVCARVPCFEALLPAMHRLEPLVRRGGRGGRDAPGHPQRCHRRLPGVQQEPRLHTSPPSRPSSHRRQGTHLRRPCFPHPPARMPPPLALVPPPRRLERQRASCRGLPWRRNVCSG
mmetsp:Transcript_59720/g.122525  ORF Transcript_59720/g.122525 Transcript_59720/m.122525 type:complete len:235 (+) Transcript_59720:89-793(+)